MAEPKRILRRSKKTGAPPGTLIHVGEQKVQKAKITVLYYDQTNFQMNETATVEECIPLKEKPAVTWIHVIGLHQVEILEKLGSCYGLHPLILEDILNTDQRPKMEDFEDYIYIVMRLVSLADKSSDIQAEQVSLILGKNFVISFQETDTDFFGPIRERIKNSKGRIRTMGADYLAYILLDIMVDNYFAVLEKFGEQIETLEDSLMANPTLENLHTLHRLKREMIYLRKSTWPLRELINGLERAQSPLIQPTTLTYLRDIYDHTIQVIDTIETYRDMLSGMVDTYLTSISNRTNEVMKVLTIIATTFIPLSFVTGLFGMNFQNMPPLKWAWGFYSALALMLGIAGSMILYFRSKKWF